MSRPSALTRRARVAFAGLLALAPLSAVGPDSAPAGAAPSNPSSTSVTVAITRVAPSALTATSTLIVNGSITNASGHPLSGVTYDLGMEEVITSRTQLQARRVTPGTVTSYLSSPKDVRGIVAPGASTGFTLSIPDAGNRLVGERVTQLAVIVSDASGMIGRAELPLPYFPGVVSPLHLAIVLPVTAAPDQGPTALSGASATQIPTPTLITDLTAGHPLDTVVQAALSARAEGGIPATNLTLAVDPALLVRVCALAHECSASRASPGTTAEDTAIAKNWLSELFAAAALPTVSVVGLPYADADVAALADYGDRQTAGQLLATANRQVHGILTQAAATTFEPLLADGPVTPQLMDAARSVGIDVGVVSDSQAAPTLQPASSPPTETATARLTIGQGAPLDALVTDSVLQSLLTPAPDGNDLGHVQNLLAELGTITSEAPSFHSVRTVVLEAPRTWNVTSGFATTLIDQLAAAPYVTSVPLAVAATEPAGPRTLLRISRPATIPAATIARVDALRVSVKELAALAASPTTEQLSGPLSEALDRSVSVAWRDATAPPGSPCAQPQCLLNAVSALVPASSKPIKLGVNKGGVLLTGASGTLPVAINNSLPETVSVIVRIESEPPGQVTGLDYGPVVLPAGTASRQLSLQISARSTRSTLVDLTVRPASDRDAPPIYTQQVTVRSTAVGVVAVGITAGALTVLVLAILIRLARKLHARRAAATG